MVRFGVPVLVAAGLHLLGGAVVQGVVVERRCGFEPHLVGVNFVDGFGCGCCRLPAMRSGPEYCPLHRVWMDVRYLEVRGGVPEGVARDELQASRWAFPRGLPYVLARGGEGALSPGERVKRRWCAKCASAREAWRVQAAAGDRGPLRAGSVREKVDLGGAVGELELPAVGVGEVGEVEVLPGLFDD